MKKKCIGCQLELPIDLFRPQSRQGKYSSPITKRQSRCRKCERAWFKWKNRDNPFIKLCQNVNRSKFRQKYISVTELKLEVGLPTRCYLCGRKIRSWQDAELDHVIPKSKGGKTAVGNLKWAHKPCNRLKHDLLIPEMIGLFRRILKNLTKPS